MPPLAVAVLAAGTFALRLVGTLMRRRLRIPPRVQKTITDASVVLLVALIATSALADGQEFAGWARPAGVLVAGVLVVLRLPFPLVVIAAAVTTALLRLVGVA